MTKYAFAVLFVFVLLSTPSALIAAVEEIDGGADGYCVVKRDGSLLVDDPVDYEFSAYSGKITFKTVGSWELTYQSTSTPGDPNAVRVDVREIAENIPTPTGNLCVHVIGLDAIEWIRFYEVSATGDMTITLDLEGSITEDGWISAPEFVLTNSTIAGDVDGGFLGSAISVSSIEDDSTGLDIGRDLLKKLTVANDVSGTVNIGGDATGDIDINGACSGEINITGDLTGNLDIGDDLSGSLSAANMTAGATQTMSIGGNITSTATFAVGGNFAHRLHVTGNIEPNVVIPGNFAGVINAGGTLDGEIRILGSFSGPLA